MLWLAHILLIPHYEATDLGEHGEENDNFHRVWIKSITGSMCVSAATFLPVIYLLTRFTTNKQAGKAGGRRSNQEPHWPFEKWVGFGEATTARWMCVHDEE